MTSQIRGRFRSTGAFTLLELLTVMAIVGILTVAVIPAVGPLLRSGNVNKAAADFSATLELARSYAMSHQTYVRVAMADLPGSGDPAGGATIILTLFAADGTLAETDMSDPAKWPTMDRPLILKNFHWVDSLNTKNPATNTDALPSSSDIGAFQRAVPGASATNPSFTAFIQFRPDGMAGVHIDTPARFIKIGMDVRSGPVGRNPFILRLSGNTGSVIILRKEDGI